MTLGGIPWLGRIAGRLVPLSGATLTLSAFEKEIGYIGRLIVAIGVFLLD